MPVATGEHVQNRVVFKQFLRAGGMQYCQLDACRLAGVNEVLYDALYAWHVPAFVFVTGYPMRKRPFYTHPQPSDPVWSNGFDLLFRGLELVTGGQRLHRAADYERAIAARGEDPAAYASYLQAFRHGMPPHGGFAIGLERWVARLVGAANVREVTLYPRDLHRLTP